MGLAFLTIGMLFGALWAKEAWGHYWSWDPKETWAAITWLAYLVYVRRDKESKEVITVRDHLFSLYHLELLLKQMRDELMEPTAPGEELMGSTL